VPVLVPAAGMPVRVLAPGMLARLVLVRGLMVVLPRRRRLLRPPLVVAGMT